MLDVAAGNGNATLAAARRCANVTSTDYVPALLERAQERAQRRALTVKFREADAEALPCADDKLRCRVVDLRRDVHPRSGEGGRRIDARRAQGGRIGLACWTPEGFIGQLFKAMGRHVPPPAGVKSPALWGTEARLAELFPNHKITATKQTFNFRYKSAEHWLDVFRTFYGPTHRAFAALDAEKQAALQVDIMELLARMNRDGARSLIVPSEYLEAVIVRP